MVGRDVPEDKESLQEEKINKRRYNSYWLQGRQIYDEDV